jgi:hypothetical protein
MCQGSRVTLELGFKGSRGLGMSLNAWISFLLVRVSQGFCPAGPYPVGTVPNSPGQGM